VSGIKVTNDRSPLPPAVGDVPPCPPAPPEPTYVYNISGSIDACSSILVTAPPPPPPPPLLEFDPATPNPPPTSAPAPTQTIFINLLPLGLTHVTQELALVDLSVFTILQF